eukprot:CAMPEP_0115001770 /NCGR_PEP_ID=MMETSP0216-20121206/17592_1 /TAXON_ID=223996 /ORGANISM="Protocruzia adherens, Strain Boccale" /LENGTH=118 /DNA_ID=CAMNT_0002367205 /DNA_START=124 /DNA_END=480 /DNA_ORIENTATION=-
MTSNAAISVDSLFKNFSSRARAYIEDCKGGALDYSEFQRLVDRLAKGLEVAPLHQEEVYMAYDDADCYEDGTLAAEELEEVLSVIFEKLRYQPKQVASQKDSKPRAFKVSHKKRALVR